jgi:hypothetical protein
MWAVSLLKAFAILSVVGIAVIFGVAVSSQDMASSERFLLIGFAIAGLMQTALVWLIAQAAEDLRFAGTLKSSST